jgi:hypothetical protein
MMSTRVMAAMRAGRGGVPENRNAFLLAHEEEGEDEMLDVTVQRVHAILPFQACYFLS